MHTSITNKTKIKKTSNINYFELVEAKYLKSRDSLINIGDIVRIGYLIPEGEKERIQYYEGLIISIKNRKLGKSFTLRRNVQGIGIEQIFILNSPKIVSIVRKQSSKVRRAKLYFLRNLSGKATRLRPKL